MGGCEGVRVESVLTVMVWYGVRLLRVIVWERTK